MRTRSPNVLARLGISLVAGLWVLGGASASYAQQRFSEMARDAVEVPEDVASWASPLLVDCRAGSASAQRSCAQGRRRAAAALLRGTYVVDLPAKGRVSIAPYEAHNGGFRIRVPALVFARSGAPGVVTTARLSGGLPTAQVLVEGFARVGRDAIARFRAANALDTLRVRVLFTVGADFTDTAATDPSRSYGVVLEVLGAQVYNEQTGSVLADSATPPTVREGAPLLMGRTILWSREARSEAAWLAPDGETVLFHTRIEPVPNQPGTLETAVFVTHDDAPVELVRFVAPCCSAAVDLRPHGQGVLMIITEVASTGSVAGRGRVLYLRWDGATHRFEIVARWEGDNRTEPPAWLRDPAAIPAQSGSLPPAPPPAPEAPAPAPTPTESAPTTAGATDLPTQPS